MNRTLILGAGPAGLGAAFQIAKRGLGAVTVLEQHDAVGGNAGSFILDGVNVDYGSHRLHPACDPAILRDLQLLLGGDLLERPRHGRIRLRERWIHFPLQPLDLALHLPPSFGAGAMIDSLRKPFTRPSGSDATFASVLEHGLGRTICRDFYFPYARKIWGVDPELLSPVQARRRVSGNSPAKMLRKIANSIPGFKPPGAGKFYYPRKGYGQLCDCLADAAGATGAEMLLGARVTGIERTERDWRVHYIRAGEAMAIDCSRIWSTLPITFLARSVGTDAPAEVFEASKSLTFRAMILIYLVLEQDQFTEYDAHYFPESSVPLTRLSEPKNYSAATEPRGVTVLCGELPCSLTSEHWNATDQQLADAMIGWLKLANLSIRSRVRRVATRRLPQAYPLYTHGYEERFETVDRWLGSFDDLLTLGRQGLFAHDNLHHALAMGYAAADCLAPDGVFDRTRWAEFRKSFERHVVED